MLYCELCRREKGWPESTSKSRGYCEVCNRPAVCHNVPSSALPKPPPPTLRELAVAALMQLKPEERIDVLTDFCTECGEPHSPHCRRDLDLA